MTWMFTSVKTKGGTTPDSNTRNSDKSDKGVEGFGHKLYMDNFFSSPDLFELSHSQTYKTSIRPFSVQTAEASTTM